MRVTTAPGAASSVLPFASHFVLEEPQTSIRPAKEIGLVVGELGTSQTELGERLDLIERKSYAQVRFTAYQLDPSRTGTAERESSAALIRKARQIENSSLAINQSGVLWVATLNGLVRSDRERENYTIYNERHV